MPSYRLPALLWRDAEGFVTAAAIDAPEGAAACAETEAAALEQLRDYLAWFYARDPSQPEPDFEEPALLTVGLPVCPEYREGEGEREKVFAGLRPVGLKVPAVDGRRSTGMRVCALPTLGLSFSYQRAETLKELIRYHAQEALKELSPRELTRRLPPEQCRLAELVVRFERPRARRAPALEALPAVAEPVMTLARVARAYEREAEVAELERRLGRERASVLIVGAPGVGKTAALVEAVRRLERPGEDGRRHWLTSAGRLIARMRYLGQWEARCEAVIEELGRLDGVLCVDNLLDLVRRGASSPESGLAAFFLPFLKRGELRMAAEATPAELNAVGRLLPGLLELFQVVRVEPLPRERAVAALRSVLGLKTAGLGPRVEPDAAPAIESLFRRFCPYAAFPGKAAAFAARLAERARRAGLRAVGAREAAAQFVHESGLPEALLKDELPFPRAEIEGFLRARVLGQEPACAAVAAAVAALKAAINDPKRPVGSFLFCGPTGVGKTALARALADLLFGHGERKERLLRLDMSEYSAHGASERLFTAPDGEPSAFVRRLRQEPFCVVLLDEIEKAAPDVFDALMGALDEGRLTDRFGRTAELRSALIVMTSNLGAQAKGAIGFGGGVAPSYEREAFAFFRPEFFNRIDRIVPFAPLSPETARRVVEKELGELAAREGFARRGLRLSWTEASLERLVREGFDPRYGARPLQRALEERVVAPLARRLLAEPGLRDAALTLHDSPSGLKIR